MKGAEVKTPLFSRMKPPFATFRGLSRLALSSILQLETKHWIPAYKHTAKF